LHLVVDRVDVLRAPADLGFEASFLQLAGENSDRLSDLLLAGAPRFVQQALELLIALRLKVGEGRIFEAPLELPDAEPVGEGRVDLERLARDALTILGWLAVERAHVVQAIAELDQ